MKEKLRRAWFFFRIPIYILLTAFIFELLSGNTQTKKAGWTLITIIILINLLQIWRSRQTLRQIKKQIFQYAEVAAKNKREAKNGKT